MRQILATAICVIVSLVVAAISTRYIHPGWMIASLHSLQFHALLACLAAMGVALILWRHPLSLILSAAVVGLTIHTVYLNLEFTQPDQKSVSKSSYPTFRLLSFNVLNTNFARAEEITRMITASGADIVNLMEAWPLRQHMDEISKTYPYRIGCGVIARDCDKVLLSRTPFERASLLSLSEVFERRFALARTVIAGRTVDIAGIHTTKPYFDNFHSLELRNASYLLADRTQGPLIVAGDFNASSLAPNMRRFLTVNDLKTFGWEPATWPVRFGRFGLPIDHIYVRDLTILSLTRVEPTFGSNHFGLVAEIAITDAAD